MTYLQALVLCSIDRAYDKAPLPLQGTAGGLEGIGADINFEAKYRQEMNYVSLSSCQFMWVVLSFARLEESG